MTRGKYIWVAFIVAGLSCREPTEIVVRVSTDVPCKNMNGSAVTVGALGAIDTRPPTSVTTFCDADTGSMGSIVVVPSHGSDDTVAIRVAAGVGADPAKCVGPNYPSSCIVARRALRYLPHQSIDLPVRLSLSCEGVACPGDQTCVAGICRSQVLDPSKCSSGGCGEGSLGAPPTSDGHVPVIVDGCGDVSGLQVGAPWPMKGRCNTRMSRSAIVGPQKLTEKWKAQLDMKALTCPPVLGMDCDTSAPVIAADGTIYVGGVDGLYAFRADGTRAWKAPFAGGSFAAPAINATGLVVVGSIDHKLYAINPGGAVAWKFDAGAPISSSPAIAPDGTIYITASDTSAKPATGALFAIDSNGNKRWSITTDAPMGDVALSLDASTVYVGGEKRFYALDASSGVSKWDYAAGNFGNAAVALDSTVYLLAGNGLTALTVNGIEIFHSGLAVSGQPPTPIAGGAVVSDSATHAWELYDRNGAQKWQYIASSAVVQPAVVGGDGKLYGVSQGEVTVLDPVSGKDLSLEQPGFPQGTASAAFSAMAMGADGTLYVMLGDARLYAYSN